MSYLGISDLAIFTKGVMSAAGIKKAAQEGRISAKKKGRVWLVDSDDPTVKAWIAEAKQYEQPESETIQQQRDEIVRLNREVQNLSLRCRQAERRAERLTKELERTKQKAAEQAQQNLERIYSLSEQVATQQSQTAETIARAMAQVFAQNQSRPQIVNANMHND